MGMNFFALGFATKLLELSDFVVIGYLDAGTGSLIFQVLVASLVSAGVVFGGAMTQLRNFFSRVVLRRVSKSSNDLSTTLKIETAIDQAGKHDQQASEGHEHRKAA